MDWETDFLFRRAAAVLWPLDFEQANRKTQGHAAARRLLQARYEGFRALQGLRHLRGRLDAILDEAGVGRG
jgi:hypothetical protein